jgi:hypothetical protein
VTERGVAGTASAWKKWRTRVIGALVLIVVLVCTYFVLAAFLPRWWAQRVADMSGHGSFPKGIGWGFSLGLLSTLIPLLLLLLGATVWRRKGGRFIAGASAMIAVLAALPNLMTLSIVLGGNTAAHAGQRILDVDAPGFRGATLIGAVIAAIVWLFAIFLTVRRWQRRRRAAAAAVSAAQQ